MPIDRRLPTPASHRGELGVTRDVHVSATPARRLEPSKQLEAEHARLQNEFGQPLVDAEGLIPVRNLQEMTTADHRELVRQFPLIGTASIQRWMSGSLDDAHHKGQE